MKERKSLTKEENGFTSGTNPVHATDCIPDHDEHEDDNGDDGDFIDKFSSLVLIATNRNWQ